MNDIDFQAVSQAIEFESERKLKRIAAFKRRRRQDTNITAGQIEQTELELQRPEVLQDGDVRYMSPKAKFGLKGMSTPSTNICDHSTRKSRSHSRSRSQSPDLSSSMSSVLVMNALLHANNHRDAVVLPDTETMTEQEFLRLKVDLNQKPQVLGINLMGTGVTMIE
jgi:hypothetical protein